MIGVTVTVHSADSSNITVESLNNQQSRQPTNPRLLDYIAFF